jgi:TPR repeat protein
MAQNGVATRDAPLADEGNAETLFELGLRFATGQGAPLDFIAAHRCFNLAAWRGLVAARERRAEIARDMTPDQIAEAQRQAREWIARHNSNAAFA